MVLQVEKIGNQVTLQLQYGTCNSTLKSPVHVNVCVTFLPPGEQVSGGGVLVMFRGLEPQLEGEEPRILIERERNRWLQ